MKERIEAILADIENLKCQKEQEIEEARVRLLGKKGEITQLFDEFRTVDKEQKKEFGQKLNVLKKTAAEKLEELKGSVASTSAAGAKKEDATLPGDPMTLGSRHPVSIARQEIINIYRALGVTVAKEDETGEKHMDLSRLRYHKVVIMTDADVDGSHIACLILTFFFRYMFDLIKNGYVYLATPPLYLVKKGKEEVYCWTDEQRAEATQRLGNGSDRGVTVQRYKGLGEMSDVQLWETTMNPEKRLLRQITIENALEAERTFSMLMGDDVPPRREFIEQNAHFANIDA